jgi:dipeptidase E
MLTTHIRLRGSWLKVDGDQVIVKGEFSARLFKQNQIAEELERN